MRITLRQLQVFRAVCEQLSYSRAAEIMALTQPAVSLQIRQLEELIDHPLFEYVGKKLYLTAAAERLLLATTDIFQRLDDLDMELSDLRGSLKGQLRIAAESSAKYLTPHLLAAFQQRFPDVSPLLRVVNRAQIIRRIAENRDDVVIMSLVPEDMALEFMPFLNNPIVVVAPPSHPLCQDRNDELTLKDLQDYPLLIREPGSGTRKACEEFFQQKRVHFARTMELNSHEAQCEGVLAGLGLAFLPRHAVYRELQSGDLKELSVKELPLYRSWCLVHARGKRLSPVMEAFIQFIRTERSVISQIAKRFEVESKE
jgi:Transcriptional regulator